MFNKSALLEAHEIINGSRNAQYGSHKKSFKKHAKIANLLLDKSDIEQLKKKGVLSDVIVCKVMMAIKLSRESYKPKRDNLVDLMGYSEILQELRAENII